MPPRDLRVYIYDILKAGEAIRRNIEGRTLDDFFADDDLRAKVERRFEIIGEALRQAISADPTIEVRITDARRIIDFRNLLIHGYHQIDPSVVWDVARTDLPVLLDEVKALLPMNPP